MKTTVRRRGRTCVVNLEGALTAGGGYIALRSCLKQLLSSRRGPIVVNLRDVTWIDRGGLVELARCRMRAGKRGVDLTFMHLAPAASSPGGLIGPLAGEIGLAPQREEG